MTSTDPSPGTVVERVPAAVTYALRQRVLRPGRPVESLHLPSDDDPATGAFAAFDPDRMVVGTAIVFPEACPWMPEEPAAWRLRGMATSPERRGAGIGERVLSTVVAHVRSAGGQLIWCNARVPARRFYERAGFIAHGDEWVDPEIGPHVAMWRRLG